jgi:dihydroorotase
MIDPHVHCRDWDQSYKATILSTTQLAREQGIKAIFDMPNTIPIPITTKELVDRRFRTAEEEGCSDGYYLYIGATEDPEQLREAIEVVKSNSRVIGMKMYAGKSVGDLAIVKKKSQMKVYKELSDGGYDGVLVVHCEKESLFNMDLWDPRIPYSWNLARPKEAEVGSIKDQIELAKLTKFEGNLHVCHISCPEAVDVVQQARGDMRITCAATPHHPTYSTMNMMGRKGLMYKVNSPLRYFEDMMHLRRYIKLGLIDWIETDNAPHTRDEKMYPPYMSGIQSMKFYSVFLDSLRRDGLTEEQIHELTYENIINVFEGVRV